MAHEARMRCRALPVAEIIAGIKKLKGVIQKGCCKDSATVSVLSEAFAKKAETGINFLLNIKSVGVLSYLLGDSFSSPRQ